MQPPFRNGFTLIEIVSVLVVLGVLAYLGISAFRGNDEITAYAERDRLLSQLVYARAQGMAMGGGQCVTIDTNKVSFFMKGKSALPTLLKDYTPSASIQSTPPATFCFDAAGSVCGEDSLGNPNDTGILYCTASASDQTFSFGGGITLTLFAETGSSNERARLHPHRDHRHHHPHGDHGLHGGATHCHDLARKRRKRRAIKI